MKFSICSRFDSDE